MPRLENWSVIRQPKDPYSPPEFWPDRLHGNVYGHIKFADGEEMSTSTPVRLSEDGLRVVVRSGKEYQLGAVDPEYNILYPNARQRLLDSLRKAGERLDEETKND